MIKNIAISEVLAKLRSGDTCSLTIVRSTGDVGTLKVIDYCCSGYVYHQFTARQKMAFMREHDQDDFSKNALKGLTPIIDLHTSTTLTILISHMIYFNNSQIVH